MIRHCLIIPLRYRNLVQMMAVWPRSIPLSAGPASLTARVLKWRGCSWSKMHKGSRFLLALKSDLKSYSNSELLGIDLSRPISTSPGLKTGGSCSSLLGPFDWPQAMWIRGRQDRSWYIRLHFPRKRRLSRYFCFAIRLVSAPFWIPTSCALCRPFSNFVNSPTAVCSNSVLVLVSLKNTELRWVVTYRMLAATKVA